MAKKISEFLLDRRLWMAALQLGVLLWFDLCWARMYTFHAFFHIETAANTLLLALLLAAPVILANLRKTQAVVITLTALWLEANLMYARTYYHAIPAESYLVVGNLRDFTGSVVDSLRLEDVGFLILTALGWVAALIRAPKAPYQLRRLWIVASIALAAVSAFTLVRRGGLVKAWDKMETFELANHRVPMYTLAGWLAYDMGRSHETLSDGERAAIETFLKDRPDDKDDVMVPDEPRQSHSVVMILLESFESWPLNLVLEGNKEVTPNINALLREPSTFFAPDVVTQVGDGRSIDAQLIIDTGLLPPKGGVWALNYNDRNYPSLPRAFKEHNAAARSYILTVDRPDVWNQSGVARALGIDTALYRHDWNLAELAGKPNTAKLSDGSFVDQTIAKMRSGEIFPVGEVAYVKIVTTSGHNPWRLDPQLDNLRLGGNYMDVIARYLAVAHYTDAAVGRLVNYLRSRPDAENISIVILGDHEGLGQYRREAAKRHSFVSPQRMTPLIVTNVGRGGRFNGVMGQMDVYPTLLHLLGLDGYAWRGVGISALSARHPSVAYDPENGDIGTGSDSVSVSRMHTAIRLADPIMRYGIVTEKY